MSAGTMNDLSRLAHGHAATPIPVPRVDRVGCVELWTNTVRVTESVIDNTYQDTPPRYTYQDTLSLSSDNQN